MSCLWAVIDRARSQSPEGVTDNKMLCAAAGLNISILWHHVTWLLLQHVEIHKECCSVARSSGTRLLPRVCMCHYPSYLMLCYPLSKLSLLEKLNHYVTANNTLYITAATFKSLYTPSSRKRLESIPCSEYHVFVVVYFTTTNSNIYNILYICVIFCATAPV